MGTDGRPPTPTGAPELADRLAREEPDELLHEELTEDGLPSVGSAAHYTNPRSCKPCAFRWTKKCTKGVQCIFCHACDSGEKKRRQKEKHRTLALAANEARKARAAAAALAALDPAEADAGKGAANAAAAPKAPSSAANASSSKAAEAVSGGGSAAQAKDEVWKPKLPPPPKAAAPANVAGNAGHSKGKAATAAVPAAPPGPPVCAAAPAAADAPEPASKRPPLGPPGLDMLGAPPPSPMTGPASSPTAAQTTLDLDQLIDSPNPELVGDASAGAVRPEFAADFVAMSTQTPWVQSAIQQQLTMSDPAVLSLIHAELAQVYASYAGCSSRYQTPWWNMPPPWWNDMVMQAMTSASLVEKAHLEQGMYPTAAGKDDHPASAPSELGDPGSAGASPLDDDAAKDGQEDIGKDTNSPKTAFDKLVHLVARGAISESSPADTSPPSTAESPDSGTKPTAGGGDGTKTAAVASPTLLGEMHAPNVSNANFGPDAPPNFFGKTMTKGFVTASGWLAAGRTAKAAAPPSDRENQPPATIG